MAKKRIFMSFDYENDRTYRYLLAALAANLVFLILTFLVPLAAMAIEHKTVHPVFFATDRYFDPSVPELTYTSKQLAPDELTYGIKNIVLQGNSGVDETVERLQGLSWWSLIDSSDPNPPSRTTTLLHEDFYKKVAEIVASGPSDRPVVLYVHGCCSDFNKTMTDAARIGKAMAAPVIGYAWAAIPPLTAYKDNEPAQSKSAKRFNDFLKQLEDKVGPERLIIIGYSMGNRFLQDSLKVRYWNYGGGSGNRTKFLATCFMCADVPVYEFAANHPGVAWCSEKTIVSKNNTDGALAASNVVHGLYTRVGAPHREFKNIRGSASVTYYNIEPILRFKHDLPVELLAQILRSDKPEFKPYQIKPTKERDLMNVYVNDSKSVHTTIKD